jgi:hypothetical protein
MRSAEKRFCRSLPLFGVLQRCCSPAALMPVIIRGILDGAARGLRDPVHSLAAALTLFARSCSVRDVMVTHTPEGNVIAKKLFQQWPSAGSRDRSPPLQSGLNWYTPEEICTCN